MKRSLILFPVAICFAILLCASAVLAYTPPSPPPPNKNLYELIVLDKKLGKFAAMIEDAGLKDTFTANTGEPITVFAPTDEALDAISNDAMKRIEASKASLQSFVKYHIVAGSAVASGSLTGRKISLASANGEPIMFDGTDRAKPPKANEGSLVDKDIGATNGVLHTVNNALMPPSLAQAPLPPSVPKQPASPPPAAAAAPTPAPAPAPTPAPLRITTSGVATAPPAATTTGQTVPSMSAGTMVMPSVPPPPLTATTSPLPATSTSGGFELFGHKFGW